jgi:Uma2 family endonuclease
MAETGFHVMLIVSLIAMLRAHFRNQTGVYVGGNMFMYYQEGDPSQRVAPDTFVAFGVPPGERRSWFVWQEDKSPDVIFEVTSRATRATDQGAKKGLYEWLGVKEYFLFDPLGDYLQPPLQGYRLSQGLYQPLPSTDGSLLSEQLGLRLKAAGHTLDLFDVQSSLRLLPPSEMATALEIANAEIARLRDELARLQKNE